MLEGNNKKVDVVNILLHPANTQGNRHRLHKAEQDKTEKELKELTLRPQINRAKNQAMLENEESCGDRNIDLYNKSKVHMKRNKPTEEYEFEKNAEHLTFKPRINKPMADNRYSGGMSSPRKRAAQGKKPEFKTSGLNNPSITTKKYFGGQDGA